MEAAHAGAQVSRHHRHGVTRAHSSREHRARCDRTVTGQRKDAVHGEAEQPLVRTHRGSCRELVQVLPQRGKAGASGVGCIDRKDESAGKRRCRERRPHLRFGFLSTPHGDAIDLGERDGARGHPEELDDRQMLQRLRHHTVVRGDRQQREVDPAGSGHHGVHQALVSRHIDESQHLARGEWRVGVTELDRDTARLLFLQTIGVDARERPHQRGLAVIDVTRGADDHGEVPPVTGAAPAAAR